MSCEHFYQSTQSVQIFFYTILRESDKINGKRPKLQSRPSFRKKATWPSQCDALDLVLEASHQQNDLHVLPSGSEQHEVLLLGSSQGGILQAFH